MFSNMEAIDHLHKFGFYKEMEAKLHWSGFRMIQRQWRQLVEGGRGMG